ncbi:tRNA modification GTPase MnmE [Elysia marginata]|uniref:tRNA modification GTPase MnmE n=1 Tax=Elysia marginata TaxID=1093978 RepID=A0AAV4JXT2_9GAST|nr:tRNA modification GTPase MnmE [Elysia marginata]
MIQKDTIVAIATPTGVGAIAVLRISGKRAFEVIDYTFETISKKKLKTQKGYTIHFGKITNGSLVLDEVLVSLFKAPQSYTGEDVVEVSCHGSLYIQRELLQLFLAKGCRIAEPGEFTKRAFLNGKIDLSQAEAVADLIATNSAASHKVAMQQMKKGFASDLKALRDELVDLASMVELELDFSEEDIEFADKKELGNLAERISKVLNKLIQSFESGNAMKNGIPIAIMGKPNVGKSTLLNTILNDQKAIVSHIPGTTRDAIEEQVNINGIVMRFIDTAGVRETEDEIEQIGIQRTFQEIERASVILYLFDVSCTEIKSVSKEIKSLKKQFPDKKFILVGNKYDQVDKSTQTNLSSKKKLVLISAKEKTGIELLLEKIGLLVSLLVSEEGTVVSNMRHYEALKNSKEQIVKLQEGLESGLSGDILAIDIRSTLHYLGLITGEVTTDDLLGNIFSNFCIGK